MATTTTRQLREPFVEAAGLGITNQGLKLLGKSIPTSTYTGRGFVACLLYTSPSPRDRQKSRMPSSA